jgi:hypothetical protein
VRALPHLALLLGLARLVHAAPASAPAPIATVAIDLREVADADFRRLGLLALERKLALRLTQAGFALVARDRAPELVIRIRAEGADQLRVEARVAGVRASDRIVPRDRAELDAYHLEVIHKAVEAARLAEPALRARRPATASAPAATRAATRPAPRPAPPAPPSSRPAPDPWRAEVWGAALVLYRPGGVDPLLRVGARLARRRGLLLGGSLTVDGGKSGELTVVEWSGQLGAGWRFALPESLALDLELLGGIVQHLWRLGGITPGDGSRFAFLGNLRIELGWSPLRWLRLGVLLAPGLSDRGREHRLAGQVLWERSLFRLEAGAGLSLAIP